MSHLDNLDTSQSDRKVWLVKFPPLVAQRLHALRQQQATASSDAGPVIGRVRHTRNATESTSDFRLELQPENWNATIPKDFNMRPLTSSMQCAHTFSSRDGDISVDGRVDQQFDIEMQRSADSKIDPAYRSLTRDRQRAAATKTRVMQVIDDPRNLLMRPLPVNYISKKKPEKPTDQKRLRMEKDDLENQLFTLFEKQTIWSFIQLQRETDQPAPWLKEVLSGIAVLNKTGPNRDRWQLKQEFRSK